MTGVIFFDSLGPHDGEHDGLVLPHRIPVTNRRGLLRRLDEVIDELFKVACRALEDRLEQGFLTGKMMEHTRVGDSHALGNIAKRRATVAVRGEQERRFLEDDLAGALSARPREVDSGAVIGRWIGRATGCSAIGGHGQHS